MADDDQQPVQLEEIEWLHLQSLVKGPRAFHMGRTPVRSISIGWHLSALQLVEIKARNDDQPYDMIHITEKGRKALRERAKPKD